MLVTFHATVREAAGVAKIEIEKAWSVRELVTILGDRFGEQLAKLLMEGGDLRSEIVILVNGRNISQIAGLDTPLKADDEIAIFPPVSGG